MKSAFPLTRLIKAHHLSINAASIMNALVRAGVMEIAEYESTTGSGEIKTYKRIADAYLEYLGDCKHKVNAYVDSQNSFGAMIRRRGQVSF